MATSPEISTISIASNSPASIPQSSSYEDAFDPTLVYGVAAQFPSPASGPIGNYNSSSINSSNNGLPHLVQSGSIQSTYYGGYASQPPNMQLPPQMLSSSLPTNLNHVQMPQTFPPPPSNTSSGSTLMQSPQEEITTIFVVGFPDDMQEREFQNMFIFCPGFEAATLKIPPMNPSCSETTPQVSPTNATSADSDLTSQSAVGRKNGGGATTGVTVSGVGR